MIQKSTAASLFGIGLERIAMLKYGINNIKLLFGSDLRVLNQINEK